MLARKVGFEARPPRLSKPPLKRYWGVCRRRKNKSSASDFCNGNRILLASLKVSGAPGAARAGQNFVHVLLNHNDFVTIR